MSGAQRALTGDNAVLLRSNCQTEPSGDSGEQEWSRGCCNILASLPVGAGVVLFPEVRNTPHMEFLSSVTK